MKVYTTGINGFLGTHLKKELFKTLPLDIIAIHHDKIQSTKLKTFDNFFFLSAYGNLASQTDEAQILKANIQDLIYVLMQAKDINFKSFVYISTSSVKLKTQTTYSRSKRAAEEILLAVMEKHNKPICIIRPLSITGIGEQPEHLIPTLIRCAMTGETINFVSNSVHDYIDVDDVVNGIINLSENSARGIYELGTGIKTTNQQVLDIVEKVTGTKININKVESLRPYDNDNWVSTNFRARGYGWLPKKTLEQSIKEMVKEAKLIH